MKRNHHWHFVLPLALLALPAWATSDDDKPTLNMQIFRISASFEKDVEHAQDVWAGDEEEWDDVKDDVTIYNEGSIRIGADRLSLGRRGCHWNDAKLTYEEGYKYPLPKRSIRILYSPEASLDPNEYTEIKVISEQPFEYFSRREDGLYSLERVELPTGLEIAINPKRRGEDHYELDEMNITVRLVNQREALSGTHLPVGKPKLKTFTYPLELKIRRGRHYGILLQPDEGHVAILIRFEIR